MFVSEFSVSAARNRMQGAPKDEACVNERVGRLVLSLGRGGPTKVEHEFVKLLLRHGRGCVEHDVAARVVLGEGDAVANAVETGKERYPTIETVSQTAMRGRSKLEGIHEEAELELCLLGGEAQNLENLLLQLGIVDTDAATANLDAVDDHVVGIGTHAGGVGVEQGYVLTCLLRCAITSTRISVSSSASPSWYLLL